MIPATEHALGGRWQCSDISTQFFACRNCPCVHPFQPNAVCSTESAIFFFPLKFTDRLKWSDAECCHQSNIVPDFKNARMCLTGSISLHCGLSAGKQTRLPRELGVNSAVKQPQCRGGRYWQEMIRYWIFAWYINRIPTILAVPFPRKIETTAQCQKQLIIQCVAWTWVLYQSCRNGWWQV